MAKDPVKILIAVIVFLFLASSGVVGALANAKSSILSTILSTMSGYNFGESLGATIAMILLGATAVYVFLVIPGRLGLFRMLLGGR